jgi:hypothetical protein
MQMKIKIIYFITNVNAQTHNFRKMHLLEIKEEKWRVIK